MNIKVLSLLACMALSLPIQAQKKKEVKTADQYIQEYDFDKAEELLEKDLNTLQKRRKPTEEIEKKLDYINMARSMMLATERVVFIDSLVADKKDFLKSMKISSESGSILSFSEFFEKSDSLNRSVYLSELGNKIYFAAPTQKGDSTNGFNHGLRLFTSDLLGGEWSKASALKGLNEDRNQNYPFMLSDGVTLYYGAEGEESLGGYDIFVTRYDADSQSFLKPENIGMPFNSMANDYMYAIDEIHNLGWFVTDRKQPEGKVCIYIFVPNALRKIYTTEAYSEEELRQLALNSNISATWGDQTLLNQGRESLKKALAEKAESVVAKDFEFVINDKITYYVLDNFRSSEAKNQAATWKNKCDQLKKDKESLQSLRDAYAAGNEARKQQLSQQIRTMEQACEKMEEELKDQEIKIRNAEIQYLLKQNR